MRLCLVHGFTQTGASWAPIADALRSAGHDVVTPDFAGHGTASDVRADLRKASGLLADAVGAAAWVGYSMGGRLALHVALDHPHVVQRLVLVSSTAGIEDDVERADRRDADNRLADEIERDGVAAFIQRWLAGPMWATLPPDRAGVEHRLSNTAGGLSSSLRLAGTGAQESLWGRLPSIAAPTLIVTGGRDPKFDEIGEHLSAAIPGATHATIPGAGHAVPWEQPEAFVATLDRWLRQ